MAVLFVLTMFVGSALLFLVQPMIAKAILPIFGGTPAVWNTCMVFFQAMLLAGYLYAHLLTRRLGLRLQIAVHGTLLLLTSAALPMAIVGATGGAVPSTRHPAAWLLGRLLVSAGLPFFAVSTTAPLLQRWFAATGRPGADNPYSLYAASNLGSLLALLAFPILLEPNLRLADQGRLWAAGYVLLAALILACAGATWRLARSGRIGRGEAEVGEAIGWTRRARWVALAFLPSSLMLGVTTFLTTDIAAIPLLWVVPLSLYLLSFVLVFMGRPIVPRGLMARLLPIAVMGLLPAMAAGLVQPFWIPLHLLAFFAAAMVCHGALAADRPPAGNLTEFYLALAIGGILGGIFNALVAPLVFDRIAEYPLAIVLACLAIPGRAQIEIPSLAALAREARIPLAIGILTALLVVDVGGWSATAVGALAVMAASGLLLFVFWTQGDRPVRFAFAIGAVLFASGLSEGVEGRVLVRSRNFFGALRVTQDDRLGLRRFFHGNTLHGQQALDPSMRGEPLAYFRRGGPIGQVFEVARARDLGPGVAIVGLGVGTLASYAEPGQDWVFFEIDPAVVRIARDPDLFTFLTEGRASTMRLVLGDARLRLREAPAGGFGLIVLDAFSSDAVPVHLLTREAIRLYRSRLEPVGLLAFNLSNRYLDLDPVLGGQALDAGLACRIRYDLDLSPEDRRAGKLPSIWAVLAADVADLGAIADDPRWLEPRTPTRTHPWTDDDSDVASYLIFGRRRRGGTVGQPSR